MKALKMAYNVKKLINVERKYFDTTLSTTITSTGTFWRLTDIPQGDGASSRDGESIKTQSIHMKMWASIHASATNTLVRCILFQDRQTQGTSANPVILDILENSNVNSFRNIAFGKRFRILLDKTILLRQDDRDMITSTFNKPINFHIKWAGTTIYPTANPIYMLMFSNEPTNAPSVGGYIRIRYTDN